jgi:hypothetical protein
MVGFMGDIVLGIEDLAVAAFTEVGFKGHWHLDEDIVQLDKGNQLNFSVVLRNSV